MPFSAMKKAVGLIGLCLLALFQEPLRAGEEVVISRDSLNPDLMENPGMHLHFHLFDGWRYHPGDRAEWAAPSLDDSSWQTLNCLQFESETFSEIDWIGIGWFRLHLRVEPSLWNKSIGMLLMQTGASEIYLDGELIYSLGTVGTSLEEEKVELGLESSAKMIPIRFSEQAEHVIAVRYSNFWGMDYKLLEYPRGFQLALSELSIGIANLTEIIRDLSIYQMLFGVPLAFTLLHFLLFLFYPESKENLYYALFAASISALAFAPLQPPFVAHPGLGVTFFLIFKVSLVLTALFGIRFLYHIFFGALPWFSRIPFGIGILLLLFSWAVPVNYIFVYTLASYAEMLRIVFVAIRRKKEGARIIGLGCAVFTLACAYQVLFAVGILEQDTIFFPYTFGIIALMISMSIHLARRFAQTNRDLQFQLVQVKTLSEQALEQERQTREHERRAGEEETARKLLEADNALKAKELEEARKRQQVLDELAETNQELQATQTQLIQSEKMASLGNLVAGIAHEINTPVGAINSMHDTLIRAVDRLKETLETSFSQAYNENRAMQASLKVIGDANRVIATGTERVTGIVRSLRSFARLDEAELKEVDIHEGIDNTLMLVHHDVKSRIEVVKEYGDIPPIVCYPSRLNQVFLNLLVNASQAIEGEGEIRIRTYMEDEKVHIAIRDSGVGIPEENLGKVFDPGFTTKGVGVGTGLGLSICYQIVQDHRGEIEVESRVGEGTTFTVILPTDLNENNTTN